MAARPSPATPATGRDADAPLPAALEPLRNLFRRTWELELLISGVVVLALFQLPGRLAAGLDRLSVTLGDDTVMLAWMGYVYLQLAVIAVAAALLVHLLARAYWVGLIGLRSVFPRGVRWRRLDNYGPRSKAFYRASLPSLSRLIHRTDVFCSSIFSFAFAPAFVSIFGLVIVIPTVLVATAIDRLLFGGGHLTAVLMVMVAALVLPPTLAPLIDRKVARRPGERHSRLDRAVRAILRPYYFAFGAPLYNPIVFTFQTNIRTRAFYGIFFAIFGLLLFAIVGNHLIRQGNLVLAAGYLPLEAGADGLVPAHYRDQRQPDRVYRRPSIQSRTIDDRYLELFVPYVPQRHDELVAERCPRLEPRSGWVLRRGSDRFRALGGDERAAVDEALACVAGLFTVALDGRQLTDPSFLFSRDAASGVGGLTAFVPVVDLTPGRHLLTVRQATASDDDARPVEHHIPFWR